MRDSLRQRGAVLVPTRVGMILSELESEVKKRACPHTRGDDPLQPGLYNR